MLKTILTSSQDAENYFDPKPIYFLAPSQNVKAKLEFFFWWLNLSAWGLTLSQIVLAFNICFCFYTLRLFYIESKYIWLRMYAKYLA
jgi:hypothetical protein